LQQKLDEHDADLRARVRALYKLSAGGSLPLWVEPGTREDVLRRRGVARRVILRDLEERRELRDELARVLTDEQRLTLEQDQKPVDPPAAGSLLSPGGQIVAAFGLYQDDATHARLFRNGVELATHGAALAPAAGTVRYAGPIRGLGNGVVLDHGAFSTVIARLGRLDVSAGQAIDRGASVGAAAKNRVWLEVRSGGKPVDPAPLLARP
jgi:septal ring factor EnvC (AmiA/AmiB activator)